MKIPYKVKGQTTRMLTDTEKPIWKDGMLFGVSLGVLISCGITIAAQALARVF